MVERDPSEFESLLVQADEKPWKGFPDVPGVEYRVLRKHPENGGLTLLLRFAKGASYPTHEHPAGEEYYMLDGTLRDKGKTYGREAYVWHPPGSIHTPSSPDGCEILVVLPEAIRLVERGD
ncbi:MAG: cupin domain-containing protein [Planctomycetota bacterium]|jgi:anti-sigma factor ChrR (cupin superfamily)